VSIAAPGYQVTLKIDRSQRRLGPIWLSPGITPLNTIALFYAGMMTLVFVTTQGILFPYLLHEHLKMPTEIQGDFTGNLVVFYELVAILVIVPASLLSDRIGRRPIYVAGFLIVSISLALTPFARTPEALIAYRLITAVGMSASLMMLASSIADYPQNAVRGKLIGINGVITGVGIVLIAAMTFSQLPGFFVGKGAPPVTAGTYTYLIVALTAAISALIIQFGLKGGPPTAAARDRVPLAQLLRTGLKAVRGNPRLKLTCASYFVSRGDLLVFAMFFSLWIVAAGTDQGMTVADAQSTAGRIFGVSQMAMLLFTPVMGVIVDRLDRVTALAFAMGFAAVGYLGLGLVGDPFTSQYIYPMAILGGAGEACLLVSGPALLGQEAPAKIRGSVVGLVGLCGAVGVLIHSKIAGLLFDAWMYQAPFVYMAGFNLLICIVAIAVRIRYGKSTSRVGEPSRPHAATAESNQS
jgi:MFS family permease